MLVRVWQEVSPGIQSLDRWKTEAEQGGRKQHVAVGSITQWANASLILYPLPSMAGTMLLHIWEVWSAYTL